MKFLRTGHVAVDLLPGVDSTLATVVGKQVAHDCGARFGQPEMAVNGRRGDAAGQYDIGGDAVAPDLAGQGFYELLDRVYLGGETVRIPEMRAQFAGIGEIVVDFVYQPLRNKAGAITGVLVDQTGHFNVAFALVAAVNVLGLLGWVVILPRIAPIDWSRVGAKRSA